MKPNFTIPKLSPKDGDMSKPWFVFFRYTDMTSGEQKLFKFKKGFASIYSKAERIKYGHALIRSLTVELKSGLNPLTGNMEDEKPVKPLVQWLNDIMDTKRTVLKRKSVRTYDDILKYFTRWLSKNNIKNILPENFTPIMARGYMDYLLTERKFSGKSFNHQLGILNSFFNGLVDREIIHRNPFKGIRKMQEDTGKFFSFTPDEQLKLKEYLAEHNKRLYYACQFVYYCFIRRSELIQLKVKDINWHSMTITIQSSLSKNRRQESVTIPRALEDVLYEMELDKAHPEHYIFGHRFNTCERRIMNPDSLSGSHHKAASKLGIDEQKGFYSWKHTGVCDLYNATKDPYLVMQQCRHSDIKMTMIYLRSLGLTTNDRIRDAFYRL